MKKSIKLPIKEIILEFLDYCDGDLIHKKRDVKYFFGKQWACDAWNKRWEGKVAGKKNTSGHIQVKILGVNYLAHRLIWVIHNMPISESDEIDHIDENKTNNKINNLRISINGGNQHNVKIRKDNKSGIKGVYWYKHTNKWCAGIRVNRIPVRKYFNNIYDAKIWLDKKRIELHGNFANNGEGCLNGN